MTRCPTHGISIGEAGCSLCPKSREERRGGKVKVRGSSLRVDPKKKLKTTGRPERYMDADSMQVLLDAVAKRDGFVCFASRLDPAHNCDGDFDAAHLVEQRNLGANHPAIAEPAICLYACRFAHTQLDHWQGPFVNVSMRRKVRELAGDEFEELVFRHDLGVLADRFFEGAGA